MSDASNTRLSCRQSHAIDRSFDRPEEALSPTRRPPISRGASESVGPWTDIVLRLPQQNLAGLVKTRRSITAGRDSGAGLDSRQPAIDREVDAGDIAAQLRGQE